MVEVAVEETSNAGKTGVSAETIIVSIQGEVRKRETPLYAERKVFHQRKSACVAELGVKQEDFGEVRIGVGNGLYLKGPAVAECASSVDKKESIASGKRTDEEWLGGEGVEEMVEEKLIGQPKARKSATTESE
ncbi:hypothetical protein OS493_018547 [Desmophyllum pertusum]|uniref:Uncharacterized protein n=1 Tax=Desmophyllum pertusum TaxID=174260 RepID=A0A9X0DAE7_9CNID|nr:hypothetical protein OS493_018547 [Desmophyllum pertusum]